jgi:hypothetical protein
MSNVLHQCTIILVHYLFASTINDELRQYLREAHRQAQPHHQTDADAAARAENLLDVCRAWAAGEYSSQHKPAGERVHLRSIQQGGPAEAHRQPIGDNGSSHEKFPAAAAAADDEWAAQGCKAYRIRTRSTNVGRFGGSMCPRGVSLAYHACATTCETPKASQDTNVEHRLRCSCCQQSLRAPAPVAAAPDEL